MIGQSVKLAKTRGMEVDIHNSSCIIFVPITFRLVGLPPVVLWGTIMAVLAYLPLVGAGLVWIPAAAYLFWQGAYGKALVLVGFGVVIAVLDYLIRNILVGDRSRLHTLLVFFSVSGGLQLFGSVGIVAGPRWWSR